GAGDADERPRIAREPTGNGAAWPSTTTVTSGLAARAPVLLTGATCVLSAGAASAAGAGSAADTRSATTLSACGVPRPVTRSKPSPAGVPLSPDVMSWKLPASI